MHPNAALLTRFYQAFQNRDPAGMAACYHPEVRFSDPAFRDLRGAEAGAMWNMLCSRGKDLRVQFSDVHADADGGAAHWEAYYTFSQTGRKVHNIIDAQFRFLDGLIIEHTDRFDFARWAAQALGLVGLLFGRSSWLQKKVQAKASKSLQLWMQGGGAR